jgi:hypothetical protein
VEDFWNDDRDRWLEFTGVTLIAVVGDGKECSQEEMIVM